MATSSDMVRSFEILLSRKSAVDAALAALVKRAARKGIEGVLAWEWGKAFASTANVPNIDGTKPCDSARLSADCTFWTVPVARIPLTLTGETPRIQGWRFIATLQHLDGENVVRTLPGEDLPVEYRTRGPMCDHCRSLRRRNDTYVLRHEDGRTIQVGSSCLEDFLGSDDAAKLAARAETLALALAACEGDDEGFGGGGVAEVLMPEYLAIVAWCVRTIGWTSRTAARDTDGCATADCAWNLLFSAKARADAKCEPTDDDKALALGAEGWAESLTDEAVNGATSDYLHNLRAVCRTGRVEFRTAGIAASAITAYQRHLGAERARLTRPATLDAYVGTVGEKVTFGLPAEVTKKGTPKKGAPTVLSASPVTLEFVTGYETAYGYTTVLRFRSAEGATLVWKSTSADLSRADVGKQYTLAGNIKSHEEYKGSKQTIMTRCTVAEVPGEMAVAA